MPQDDPSKLRFSALLAARLACPACHGILRFGEGTVDCANCGRVYPIIDGIPVLIAERAIIPDD